MGWLVVRRGEITKNFNRTASLLPDGKGQRFPQQYVPSQIIQEISKLEIKADARQSFPTLSEYFTFDGVTAEGTLQNHCKDRRSEQRG